MRLAILLSIAAFFWAVSGPSAQAGGCGGTFSGIPAIYGYGFSGTLYGLGRIPVPPYFALHPPVYYSEQVARPYGLSPFAYRSAPVESHRVKPTVITNPYVTPSPAPAAPSKPSAKQSEDTVTSRSQMIVNPFVEPAVQVAQE